MVTCKINYNTYEIVKQAITNSQMMPANML